MIEGSWILLLISFLLNNALLFVRGLPVYTSESSHGYQDLPRTLDLLSTYRDKLSSSHAPNGQHSEVQMHSSLPHPSEMHGWLSLSPPKQDVSRKSLDMLPPPMVRFDSTLYSNPIDWLPPHPTADLADYSRPPIGSHLKDSHTEAGHQMASSSTTSLQQVTMNHGTNHLTGKWWHTGLSRTEKKAYKKLLDASLAKTKDDRNGMLRKYYERLTLEQKQRAIEAYLTQDDEAMEQIADEFVESIQGQFPRKTERWTKFLGEGEKDALKAVARLSNRKRSSSNEIIASMSVEERKEAIIPGTDAWQKLSAKVKLGRPKGK